MSVGMHQLLCPHCGHGSVYAPHYDTHCHRCKRQLTAGGIVLPPVGNNLGYALPGNIVYCDRHRESWDQKVYLRCPRCVDEEHKRDLQDALRDRMGKTTTSVTIRTGTLSPHQELLLLCP